MKNKKTMLEQKRDQVLQTWRRACAKAFIDPRVDPAIVKFPDNNPWAKKYREALIEYAKEMFEAKPGEMVWNEKWRSQR